MLAMRPVVAPAVVECSHGDHGVAKRFLCKHKTNEMKDTQLIWFHYKLMAEEQVLDCVVLFWNVDKLVLETL